VAALFSAVGDITPVMTGKSYRGDDKGAISMVGTGPRVLFIPHTKGTLGGPFRLNEFAGTLTCGCDVHVRAPESGTDEERFDAAEELLGRVLNCLRCAPSEVATVTVQDDSPTDVDAFGADLVATFTYARGVDFDDAIWEAARALASTYFDPGDDDVVQLNPTVAMQNLRI
jgi:hypothetical protein